jgi:hypothetical protein
MPEETTSRICENAIDMVGNTPLVYLNKVTKGLDAKIGKFFFDFIVTNFVFSHQG